MSQDQDQHPTPHVQNMFPQHFSVKEGEPLLHPGFGATQDNNSTAGPLLGADAVLWGSGYARHFFHHHSNDKLLKPFSFNLLIEIYQQSNELQSMLLCTN